MNKVRPKKSLGQHFLNDRNIARKIAYSLSGEGYGSVLEIGPGMGILTQYLLERKFPEFAVIEIDNESADYLELNLPELKNLIRGDFLSFDIDRYFSNRLAVIGNFPYNISSQIFFKILKHRDKVAEVCCMLQKEVAARICAGPGSRTYGILSVLLQAYYSTEYLFAVPNTVFYPPPKVQSAVVLLKRNKAGSLDCDEELFIRVVRAGFNQRRKILKNSISAVFDLKILDYPEFYLRPEQLSVGQFVNLTNWIRNNLKDSE